jgi:SAM-dependent methyltransferase
MQQALTSPNTEFYSRIYDRLYRLGYHRHDDYSHAKKLVEQITQHWNPQSVLDVGCSIGWTLDYFSKRNVHAVGVDVSKVAIAKAQRLGRDARLASAHSLPFHDRAFDVVLSTDCLEHLRPEDAPQAVREICRVARLGIAIKINPRQDRNRLWKWIAGTPLHLTCVPVETWLCWFALEGFNVLVRDDTREEYLLQRTSH